MCTHTHIYLLRTSNHMRSFSCRPSARTHTQKHTHTHTHTHAHTQTQTHTHTHNRMAQAVIPRCRIGGMGSKNVGGIQRAAANWALPLA